MTDDQKALAANIAAAVVRDVLTSGESTSNEEINRLALAAVDALTAVFAKINEAN